IGAAHEKWGEAVTAIVVLNPGAALTAENVITHCKARLGSVKAPKTVHFRNQIPRTPAGKFDKKAIRAEFWKGASRNVN
ncbi:MAG: AMP-dependent synthetase, partial [Alphaproteobacteria bacterium]|nr:AMP-dependent synthetase [Alphaproteobacteria bacterium]